jgi:sulfatase maturation enzyme AslB (radical SAM superfamily)
MQTFRCNDLQNFSLYIQHPVGEVLNEINFCCFTREAGHPGMRLELDLSAKEHLQRVLKLRGQIIEGLKNSGSAQKIRGCYNCPFGRQEEWGVPKEKIGMVCLSLYPSPCNAQCFYCAYQNYRNYHEGHAPYFHKGIEIIREAKQQQLITIDTNLVVNCGELSVHPLKHLFLDLCYELNLFSLFGTNAILFDHDIAQYLQTNPRGTLSVSIDSGTPATWLKVKGAATLNQIIKNLHQYRAITNEAQIILKYNILPGVNDATVDFVGVVEILKTLNLRFFELNLEHSMVGSIQSKTQITPKAIELGQLVQSQTGSTVIYGGFTLAEQALIKKGLDE